MSNILHFTARNARFRSDDNLAKTAISQPVRQYAAMPSWITGCPALNKAITRLQDKGWAVKAHPTGEIICSHPCFPFQKRMAFTAAQRLQDVLDQERTNAG